MKHSYQTEYMSKQNYQKTSSLTNYQWNDMQESMNSVNPSFLSSASQLASREAEFMMIEDGLSRHYNYIQKNLNRIPNFPSSEEAKKELDCLLQQLNQMQSVVTPSQHPNIEGRLSEISKQHQTLNDEEQRITELRSINNGDKARDDAEYESIKRKIKEAKEELARLENQITQFNEQSTTVRSKLDKAKSNLQSRQSKINQLKEEENRLLKLQKQSRHELMSIQNELNNSSSEEAKISEIEAKIEANSREYKRLSMVLSEKNEKVREKTEKIAQVLKEIDTLDRRFDEAVGFAETVIEQKKQEAYLTSDSDSNDIEKSLNVLSMNNSSIKNKIDNPASAMLPSEEEYGFNSSQNLSNSVNNNFSDGINSINNYSFQSSFKSKGSVKNQLDNFYQDQLLDDEDNHLDDNLYHQNSEPINNDYEQINIYNNQIKAPSPNSSQYQKIDLSINSNNYQSKDHLSSSSGYQSKNQSFDYNNYQAHNSDDYQPYNSHNSIFNQEKEESFKLDNHEANQSFSFNNYQTNNQYINSNNKQAIDHSSSSSLHQIQDQLHNSNYKNEFSDNSNNLIFEEEEEVKSDYFNSDVNVHSISTKNNPNISSNLNNSQKTYKFTPADSDSDDELDIINNHNANYIDNDDDDDDDDDEDEKVVKTLKLKNEQRHSSFSSKGNNYSDIVNNAYQAINTSTIDNSPVINKVESTTYQFKKSYI